jgi:hypothetical protein
LLLPDQQARAFATDEVVLVEPVAVVEAADAEGGRFGGRQVNQLVITRGPKMCNFLDYKEFKIVYKRFASLYFIAIVDKDENELTILELMQAFVEVLDKFFGNVCELDLIFNFHKVTHSPSRLISSLMNSSSQATSASPTKA